MAIRSFEDHTPVIAMSAYIDETALVIGDVGIGEHSSLWPMVVARGDVNRIVIGAYTNIQDGSILHGTHDGPFSPAGHPVSIGDRVTVGHQAILHACRIEDDCLIGMRATVMDGAVLNKRVVLAAGSLVPGGKVLEGGFLWVGTPARRARALTEREIAYLEYSATHYARLKERHRAGSQSL
ncbi:MAG: gamma carbonic anhydrase family protein [Pseudomonadota bacterium]|nr:gamma carbonic anhydrase family protein [Pseudomonadota bacterium]